MDLELAQMITANVSLDVFSIILTLIPIVYLLSGERYKQRINLYFLGVAVSNIFMIIGDLSDWLLQRPAYPWQKFLLSAGTALFYSASAFVLYFFARYIIQYMQIEGKSKRICLLSVTAVCSVQIFFALTSPFTGSLFYVTDQGYQRGRLFMISQLVPIFCYLLFTTLVIIYHKKLKRREVVFFLFYIFVPLGGGAVQMFIRGIAVINSGVALALLLIFVNIQFEFEIALREKEKELIKQEKEFAKQRIDIMLSQIQPHFLYNSLGAIYRLCKTDPENARKSIRKFSDFLRGNMDSLKAHESIHFEKELNHVKNFLYLEQQRFGDKLQTIYEINTKDFFIPPLTLQPLVENAVQHGILNKKKGGTIVIHTEKTDEYAMVIIKDDGIGMEKAKVVSNLGDHAHIGISNVRSRLEEMVNGDLEIESSDQGTTVTLRIPLGGYRREYMRILIIDDEPLMLDEMASILHVVRPEAEILAFCWPDDALEAAREQPVDVAFLDIQMGGMTGLQLAARLKKIKPDIHIIFVTGYSQYAVEAFAMHATGYLMKPVTIEDMEREMTFIYGEWKTEHRIKVKTFGGFDVYVEGKPVKFERTKAKELLAYLVDRRGGTVTTGEAYAILFEDAQNTVSGKTHLRMIIHSLKSTLQKVGAADILVKVSNSYAITPDKIDCDYYRFLEGDPVAVNQYQNDYLPAYSWAEERNAGLSFRNI